MSKDTTTPYPYRGPGKKSLFKIPLLNTMMRANGMIPIDRKNRKTAIESINKLGMYAKRDGSCIIIAPEGKRRRKLSGELDHFCPFKKGPFHLARDH